MNKLISVDFGKIDKKHPDSAYRTVLRFTKPVPNAVKRALANVLQCSSRMEEDNSGSVLIFFHNTGHSEIKERLAKQALHRVGFQRFDRAFGGTFPAGGGLPAETEEEFRARLDRLFGCDAKRFGFSGN